MIRGYVSPRIVDARLAAAYVALRDMRYQDARDILAQVKTLVVQDHFNDIPPVHRNHIETEIVRGLVYLAWDNYNAAHNTIRDLHFAITV